METHYSGAAAKAVVAKIATFGFCKRKWLVCTLDVTKFRLSHRESTFVRKLQWLVSGERYARSEGLAYVQLSEFCDEAKMGCAYRLRVPIRRSGITLVMQACQILMSLLTPFGQFGNSQKVMYEFLIRRKSLRADGTNELIESYYLELSQYFTTTLCVLLSGV